MSKYQRLQRCAIVGVPAANVSIVFAKASFKVRLSFAEKPKVIMNGTKSITPSKNGIKIRRNLLIMKYLISFFISICMAKKPFKTKKISMMPKCTKKTKPSAISECPAIARIGQITLGNTIKGTLRCVKQRKKCKITRI